MSSKLTEEAKLARHEARNAATSAKHMAQLAERAAEKEKAKLLKGVGPLPFRGKSAVSIAAYNSAVAAAMGKKVAKAAAKAATVSTPVSRGLWVTWVHGDPSRGIKGVVERYPAEYAEYVKTLTSMRGAQTHFASKASESFGKADYEALAEEYAEEESPAAAAAPAFLSAAPAPASPSPALPVAALIKHIDTIHAEVGAIRSLLAGLHGGSQKQKRKQRRKTRRLRK